jgi:hypothetical protein
MYNEESFQEFMANAIAYVKNKEEAIIKEWLDSIGYTEPVAYYRNIHDSTMEIYATKVGCLIGKAGVNVYKLENILSKEFYGEYKVKFIEIRGGFVNGNETEQSETEDSDVVAIEINMEKVEYERLKSVLENLKELAECVDAYEDDIIEDYRNMAEHDMREIIDTLLKLEI